MPGLLQIGYDLLTAGLWRLGWWRRFALRVVRGSGSALAAGCGLVVLFLLGGLAISLNHIGRRFVAGSFLARFTFSRGLVGLSRRGRSRCGRGFRGIGENFGDGLSGGVGGIMAERSLRRGLGYTSG